MNANLYAIEHKSRKLYFLYQKKTLKEGETGFKWHEHSFYEILFFIEGESEYVIENRCYNLKGGDVLFINPGYHHFEHKIIKSPTKLFCLGFLPEEIESGRFAEQIFENGEVLTLDTLSPVYKILDGAKEKLEGAKDNAELFVKSLIEAVILMLLDADAREKKQPEIKNAAVQKILDYVKSNLTAIHKISDISSALFFSESYVRTIFKKEMGIGVMEYIRNKKVLLANRKIKDGGKPTEIYLECGFSNYPSFYRAYLSYFGCPPKTKKAKEKNRA